MKKDPNVVATLKKYPTAYCCSDENGHYIVSEHAVVGKGKHPVKAWKNAAEIIKQKKKGSKATRLRTPRKVKL